MAKSSKARLPPRWFVRTFWRNHRRVYRLTGGRLGLWRAKPNRWGAMCVRAVGRRSGLERRVIVGYFEDGENLVVLDLVGLFADVDRPGVDGERAVQVATRGDVTARR